MWKVQTSGCDGYLTWQRKSISITAGQRKAHTFQKGEATQPLPRGITCRAQQQSAIHQMPMLQGSKNVVLCQEWKTMLLGCCRKSRPRILTMWEVSMFLYEIIHHNILSTPFQQTAWTPLASLHGFVLFIQRNWNIPCTWKYTLPFVFHVAVWLHIWAYPQEQLNVILLGTED